METTINVKLIAAKIADKVKITVMAETEYLDYTKEYDKEVVESIKKMKKQYGLWGWCSVEVKGEYKGIESSEYLSGCSYKGKRDFIETSGYYDDMKASIIDDIAKQLLELISDFITEIPV